MMEESTGVPQRKPKRLTSPVWEHFERIKKADMCHAICVHCKKKLSGSSNSGTTHLRNHLIRCLKQSNHDVSQLLPSKKRKKDSAVSVANFEYMEGPKREEVTTPKVIKFEQEVKRDDIINFGTITHGSVKFDQDRSQSDLARMIMLHGYPLSMVDHVGFKMFVKNLQPLFEMTTNSTIELDLLTIYGKEKQKVYNAIHAMHGRICLVVDKWTSPENAGFLCLTAHFIDENWKIKKKILNFIALDSSYTSDLLSELIIKCLTDWDIDKMLFAMTFDNDFTNDDSIPSKVQDWWLQNKPLLKNSQLFDMRCATQMLKSIAWDAMKALVDVTHKIRESIRYVKSSQGTLGKFNEIAQQVNISSQKLLILDNAMQWNSTYLMLETALDYRGAFSVLQEQDAGYTVEISEREWEWVNSITGYVKLLVDVINVVSGNKYPNSDPYFAEICYAYVQLIEWCKTADDYVGPVAEKIKTVFERYWSKCILAFAIAAILDPRFKMKLIEYYYRQIYGDAAASVHLKKISDGIKQLFLEYAMCSNSLDEDSAKNSTCKGATRDRLRGFDKFLTETSQIQSLHCDLDKYLEEPVFPRNFDFDILNWWKVHMPRYPILSMMARDVLGLPLSTLGPELAFSIHGRILDNHRSSLKQDIREALICGQDWLTMESEETSTSSLTHLALPHLDETI